MQINQDNCHAKKPLQVKVEKKIILGDWLGYHPIPLNWK